MGSHLLSLPAELRNQIYEYALVEPRSLFLVNDAHGVGHLCLHTQQAKEYYDQTKTLPSWWGPRDVHNNNGLGTMAIVGLEKSIIANQLQFVCRQLRLETKGLSLRLNTITMIGNEMQGQGVYKMFLNFTKTISASQHKHLRTIILRDGKDIEFAPWAPSLEAVCNFCRSHPRVLVKYHQWKARPAGIPFLLHAVSVKHIYRRDTSFVLLVTSDVALQKEFLNWDRSAIGLAPLLPQNLRMFPADDVFDEQAFRSAVEEDEVEGWIAETIAGGVNSWIVLIRNWYEKGL
jgi:hypothetical protein